MMPGKCSVAHGTDDALIKAGAGIMTSDVGLSTAVISEESGAK